jgi:hypothetical protein
LHPDGGGLYLQVTSSKDGKQLSKGWLFVFRSSRTGQAPGDGQGSLGIIGEARDAVIDARRLNLAGKDPIEERNTQRVERRTPAPKSRRSSNAPSPISPPIRKVGTA